MTKEYIVQKQTAMVRRIVSVLDESAVQAAEDLEFDVDWKSIKSISTVDDVNYWFRLWPKNWLTFVPGRRTLHIYKVYGWGDYTGHIFCGKSFLDEVPRLLPLCKQCLRFFSVAVCDELCARKHRPKSMQEFVEVRRVSSYA